MEAFVINVMGAYTAACYFGVLPFVLILVVALLRHFGIQDNSILKGKPLYVMTVVGLMVYFTLLWTWLFHDQFYELVPQENGEWRLVYQMPERATTINAADIEKIQPGWGGKGNTRIIINMQDGTRYRSAQLAQHRLKEAIDALNALR
jgi:hypothetical protein